MSLAFSLSAYLAGTLSDRCRRRTVLVTGLELLIAADLALRWLPGWGGLVIGVILWGMHLGLTQGVFSTLVADSVRTRLRSTAFGLFNLLTGGALLLANVLAAPALLGVSLPPFAASNLLHTAN